MILIVLNVADLLRAVKMFSSITVGQQLAMDVLLLVFCFYCMLIVLLSSTPFHSIVYTGC